MSKKQPKKQPKKPQVSVYVGRKFIRSEDLPATRKGKKGGEFASADKRQIGGAK